MKTIRVEIDQEQFWRIGHPVHRHIYVGKTLRAAGIPVVGGLEIEGIEHGRLVHFNEERQTPTGPKKYRVYEWTPGADTPKQKVVRAFDEEEEAEL